MNDKPSWVKIEGEYVDINAGAKKSWAKLIGDWVDIIAKIGIGIGAALFGVYLTWDKNKFDEVAKKFDQALETSSRQFDQNTKLFDQSAKLFDQDAKCAETKSSIFQFAYGKRLEGDLILEVVNYWVPTKCSGESQEDRGRLVSALLKVSNSRTDRQPVSSEASSGTPPDTSPPPTAPEPPKTGPVAIETSKKGWVAVGFANSSDFNFFDKNGNNITAAPAIGTIIRAKWPVNIRPTAADWKAVVAVLNQNECFKTESTESLRAAGQFQIWASGQAVPCS